MTEKAPVSKTKVSADWLLRGALAKIGDTVDRLTGRRWIPSSSLATSELIERIKRVLDDEAETVPGKGIVVPHRIRLTMQWDKFSADAGDKALLALEQELLTAAADHINDSLYYTYAPLSIEVKPDYFTEGVKLFVSFEKQDDEAIETNVTLPAINLHKSVTLAEPQPRVAFEVYVARFEIKGSRRDRRLEFPAGIRVSVGRTSENALMIDDISVSKIHAVVVATGGSLSVADTGSTNGTFVNGERISYGKALPLSEGDRVKFGDVEVVFEHVPQEPDWVDPETGTTGDDETIAIDGFEFTSRVPEQAPPGEIRSAVDDDATLKIERDAADGSVKSQSTEKETDAAE